jgi:selenocysteine lyase/cysteine desulfurase
MEEELQEKFEQARRLFPHTKDRVYFNSASYGPFSVLVKKAVEDNVALRLQAHRDDSHDAFAAADELRAIYADFIGAQKKEIGLGLNTSFGLNIAAFGLPLEQGDEVLLSDVEFPALVYTWRAAAEARGLKLKFLKSANRCFDIEEFKKAITRRSRVLAVSFVQYFNGFKNNLSLLSQICKDNGMYLVVDGIQGMGVEPLNVRKTGIDIFSSGCQKWMLAPQGCGFFYLSEEIQQVLRPPFMSWQGVDWKMDFNSLVRYDLPYFDSARRFELGYYVVLNLLGMRASAQLFKELGIANIQRHNYALIDRLAAYIKSNPFYTITSCMDKKHRSSIFTFTCPAYKVLHREILKSGIVLVHREGSLRVSVHLFNNEDDIDKLIEVLERFSHR